MSSQRPADWAPWLVSPASADTETSKAVPPDSDSDSDSTSVNEPDPDLNTDLPLAGAPKRRHDSSTALTGDREQGVLDAAEALLREGGEAALTMDALAERLGISRATLYRWVGSRDALAARLIDERSLPASLAEPSADALRRRILQSMRDLLASDGVRGVTMERVAREAGVGSATVYRHFGDRAGLIRAFAEAFRPEVAIGRLGRAPSEDLRGELCVLATDLIRFLRDHHDLVRLRFSGDSEALAFFDDARSTPERLSLSLQRYFRAQSEAGRLPGKDPDLLAMAFMGLLLGCALARPPGWESMEEDEEKAAGALVDLFLDGATMTKEVGRR